MNKEFSISKWIDYDDTVYYHIILCKILVTTTEISDKLGISREEYINGLTQHGAIKCIATSGDLYYRYTFKDKKQARNLIRHLNEKYLVMLKLCGKI